MKDDRIIDDIGSEIDKLNTEVEEIQKKYEQSLQELMKKIFVKFFAENPDVTCIKWKQYTPYFNDGDECVFGSYAYCASFTNAEDYQNVRYGEYEGDNPEKVWIYDPDYGSDMEATMPKQTMKNCDDLLTLLGKIKDETYRAMFGDHCIVMATPSGFETEEYEHD
jgi:hypothetical protein